MNVEYSKSYILFAQAHIYPLYFTKAQLKFIFQSFKCIFDTLQNLLSALFMIIKTNKTGTDHFQD